MSFSDTLLRSAVTLTSGFSFLMASKEAEAICKHDHVTLQSKGKMPIHVDNGVLCWLFLVVKLGESEGKHN